VIQIIDDRAGFIDSVLTSTGQGFGTMHYRAEALGGVLGFDPSQPKVHA
jgi:signal transduction histidine kinase